MAATSSPVSGVADRYASALFDLARDANAVDAVEGDLRTLGRLVDEDRDFRRFVTSPLLSADEQLAAVDVIMRRANAHPLTANFVRLVARNRRLFALTAIVKSFLDRAAQARGETTAIVTSARPLQQAEKDELGQALATRLGRRVTLDTRVDPAILGGLVVRIGSRMIDSSLRTRLNQMKTRLKEAY